MSTARAAARGIAGARLEGAGVSHVHPRALARQQLGIDGLAHEGVAEVVLAPGDHQDPGVDGLAEGDIELGRAEPGDLGQNLVVDATTARGEDAHHLLRAGPSVS